MRQHLCCMLWALRHPYPTIIKNHCCAIAGYHNRGITCTLTRPHRPSARVISTWVAWLISHLRYFSHNRSDLLQFVNRKDTPNVRTAAKEEHS
jgi:hypothetical protein